MARAWLWRQRHESYVTTQSDFSSVNNTKHEMSYDLQRYTRRLRLCPSSAYRTAVGAQS